ncbi:MAG: DUF6752 domain-containing protein [Nocardioidaceae bacterium]
MGSFQQRVAGRLARLRSSSGSGESSGSRADLGRQVARLRSRVAELEHEVIENRMLTRRIAELTDVVEQLLLPNEMRDPQRLEERLGQIRARH